MAVSLFRLSNLGIALFVTVLSLPVATGLPRMLGAGDEVSMQENRKLNPWPGVPATLPELRRWPGNFNSWFDDRFGLRDVFIGLHNYGKAALGVSPSDRVVLGRAGWVFINSAHLTDANRGARPFAPGEARRLAEHFAQIQSRLAERGVTYVHLTPPDKQSLFGQYLPARIRTVGPSRYGEWRDAVRTTSLNYVHVLPVFRRSLDAGETPYMQTDSHWNCYGAYLAYREIIARLNEGRGMPLPVLGEADVSFRPFVDPVGGDLVRNALGTPYLFPETLAMSCPIATPANATYTALEDGATLSLTQTYVAARPSRVVNHDFPDGPRALVLRDSYTNAMIPFLNRSFGEVIYMTHSAEPLDESLIDELNPDIVVFEHIERTLMRFGAVIGADGLPLSRPRGGANG
jgi:hypothetical protein